MLNKNDHDTLLCNGKEFPLTDYSHNRLSMLISASEDTTAQFSFSGKNDTHVDFGLWSQLSPSQLSCPLDVHSGNVARKLGLLNRSQNDAKALAELDTSLRKLDPTDPVKYDFALFGLGVFEKF